MSYKGINPSTSVFTLAPLAFNQLRGFIVTSGEIDLALASLIQAGVIGIAGQQQLQGNLFFIGDPSAGPAPLLSFSPPVALTVQDGVLAMYATTEGSITAPNALLDWDGTSFVMSSNFDLDLEGGAGITPSNVSLSNIGEGSALLLPNDGTFSLGGQSTGVIGWGGNPQLNFFVPSLGVPSLVDLSDPGAILPPAYSLASGTLIGQYGTDSIGNVFSGGLNTSVAPPGSLPLAGDVTGTTGASVVSDLQGFPLLLSSPSVNNVLEWDGTNIIFGAGGGGGGGGLTLIQSLTASSSATLDFIGVFTNTYDDYLIEFVDIVPATTGSGNSVDMQFSANSGATWDTSSANYSSTGFYSNGTTYNTFSTTTDPGMQVFGDYANSTLYPIQASLRLRGITNSTSYKQCLGQSTASHFFLNSLLVQRNNVYLNTAAQDSLRIICISGAITSGTVRVYGFQT